MLFTFVALVLASTLSDSDATVKLGIRVSCPEYIVHGSDRPMPHMLVSLRKKLFLSTTKQIEQRRTNEHGEAIFEDYDFSTNENEGKLIVRAHYDYANKKVEAESGTVPFHVTDLLKFTRKEDFPVQKNATTEALSVRWVNVTLTDKHCTVYLYTNEALEDFLYETGAKKHPCGGPLYVVSESLAASHLKRVPFSTTDTIRVPTDKDYDLDSAKHELGHTLRHCLDGDYLHYLRDVVKYNYISIAHYCYFVSTTEGKAFNEGWADYWAGSHCSTVPYGSDALEAEEGLVEGRISIALAKIGQQCHDRNRHRKFLYKVLEANPGKIHTLGEFEEFHYKMYGCGRNTTRNS